MKKFKYNLWMPCTEEAWIRDIEERILKLGWDKQLYDWNNNNIIYASIGATPTIFNVADKNLWLPEKARSLIIEEYNPELFLVLASQREGEDFHPGEWVIYIGNSSHNGQFLEIEKKSTLGFLEFKNSGTHTNINSAEYYRKATKEELIAHFAKKPTLMKVEDLKEKECIHVPTEADRIAISALLTEANIKSAANNKIDKNFGYGSYGTNLCWYPVGGSYGSQQFFEQEKYTIYPASLFINQTENMNQIIRRKYLKEIYDVACLTWKSKIAEMGMQNPFSDSITLTDIQVKEMFNAASEEQKKVLRKYLKEEAEFDSSMLKEGEIIVLKNKGEEGTAFMLRSFDGLVGFDNNGRYTSTWGKAATFKGERMPPTTIISLRAK